MSHKSIRLLIEDTVKSLREDIGFEYGRESDFNKEASWKVTDFYVNLDPLSATPSYTVNGVSNYQKVWLCSMAFYGKDQAKSTQEEYSRILDATDELVDQFLNKLNFFTMKSDQLLISGVRQDAFVKTTAAILTGHILTFSLSVLDDFDYCQVACKINSNQCI